MKEAYKTHFIPLSLLLGSFGTYLITLFVRVIQIRPEGIFVGHEHVWADWPLHIGIAQIFATRSINNWFTHHPMYAYGKFTYSWGTDFISGLLMRNGVPVNLSFIIPSIIFSILLIIGMYFFIFLLTKSKKVAVLAVAIFFLASGPGFVNFLGEFVKNPSLELLAYPPKHYSRIDQYSWYAGNFVVGMLVPQRAFLLGLPLALWSMIALIYGLKKQFFGTKEKIILIVGGIGMGLLPIAHIHSFISASIILGVVFLMSIQEWRKWIFFLVPAGMLSLLLYFVFISGGIENKNFISVQWGYTAKGSLLDWIVMWYRLWGITIPVALLGIFTVLTKPTILRNFLLGFCSVFIVANCVLFQPVEWDNAKFFLWAYLGFSIGAAVLLVKLASNQYKILGVSLSIIVFLLLTLTGVLELTRLQHVDKNGYQIISSEDMNLAEQVRAGTDQNAVFLTTTATNHWVMMWAARPIMMGFVGWVNNFGFLYDERLNDMHTMFEGKADTPSLLKKYQISYVVIGPGEFADFKANDGYYKLHYREAFSNQYYRVYDVR